MKKSLFGFVALAAMLGATSCSQEAELNGDYGKQKTVTFTVNVDDAVGRTRAISDGSQATQLYYQVFDSTGKVDEGDATVTNLTATVDIDLITGTTYDIAFWAQDPSCEAYNATDLKNVTIDYSKVTNNDESMDAFFANVNLNVTAETPKQDVTLHRPFAQVNVGIEDANGLGIAASTMTIKGQYYNSINLVTGIVGEPVSDDLVYTSAAVPTEKLTVNETTGDTQKQYDYLSMAYVLTPYDAEGNSLLNLEFTFTGSSTYTLTKDNVPVNRNYRTNIISSQDMQSVSFEITVDPNYTDPDFSNNGNLVPDEAQGETPEQPEQVTVSNLDVKVVEGNVNFSADYTGDVTSAYFVCTPATRAESDDVRVEAIAKDGKLTATAEISQFAAGVSYTTTVEVNGEPVEAEGPAPEVITPNTDSTDPDQPGEEPGEVKTVTATFDFATNSYGQTVYDGSNSNGYPDNGTKMTEEGVTLTINPGGQGSGCRFWSTGTAQQFRIMKSSNIELSVENGKIISVEFTGGKLTPQDGQSAVSSWTGSVESLTLTNNSSSTVSLTELKVTYEYSE